MIPSDILSGVHPALAIGDDPLLGAGSILLVECLWLAV